MKISHEQLKQLIEAAIFVSDLPISRDRLKSTVLLDFSVSSQALNKVIQELILDYAPRGIVLQETASGLRFVSQDSLSQWLGRLWQETAPKYSRALLETLALIAYRQPITRGEIEQVRGVTVSSHIMKTLQERDWVCVAGHKEVPGRPALYATTKVFLDYFGMQSLSELPDVDTFVAALEDAQELTAETQNQTQSIQNSPDSAQSDIIDPEPPSTSEQLH